jgi:hypothetical protein
MRNQKEKNLDRVQFLIRKNNGILGDNVFVISLSSVSVLGFEAVRAIARLNRPIKITSSVSMYKNFFAIM